MVHLLTPSDAFDTLAAEQMPVMNREFMNDFSSTPMRPKYAYSVSRIAALIAAIFAPPLKMNFILPNSLAASRP